MVIRFRADLQNEIHQKIIERDAAVLYPMARQQVEDSEASSTDKAANPYTPLTALLKTARQEGMLAIAVFDPDGATVEAVPATQLFVELPMTTICASRRRTITRYHPAFSARSIFRRGGSRAAQGACPRSNPADAQPRFGNLPWICPLLHRCPAVCRAKLAIIDQRINRQTTVTLVIGALLVVGGHGGGLFRFAAGTAGDFGTQRTTDSRELRTHPGEQGISARSDHFASDPWFQGPVGTAGRRGRPGAARLECGLGYRGHLHCPYCRR